MASNEGGSGDQPRGVLGRNAGRTARLPSIRAPRDLTLGGAQKKTFVPNIPARPRDKGKEESSNSGRSDSRERGNRRGGRDRGRGERGRGRGRGRGTMPELLQTQSIFEQGAADRVKPRSSYEPVERGGGGGGKSREPKASTSTFKREKQDDAETKEIIANLLRDDFIEGEGLKTDNPSMDPIQLPLYSLKKEAKKEVKVKEDPDSEVSEHQPPQPSTFGAQQKEPVSVAEIFSKQVKSEHGELILLQLPDTLPGEPPEPPRGKGEKDSAPKDDTREGLSSLRDFSEGYIGKLQVRRSGRTQLVLGNVALDVNMGTPTGFLQEAVSCRMKGESGDMSVLGHVNHKMVCVPDFEAMLDAQKKKR